MAVVRIDLEINEKGEAKLASTSQQLKELGSSGKGAQAVLQGIGQGIGQMAFDRAVDGLRMVNDQVQRVIALGSGLADLSAKTSMSVESLQRMKYAGDLVGVSLDEITAASLKAQQQIEKAPGAYEKWGLSVEKLRAMQPEDQLAAIADKIRSIPEPTRQVAAAMDLLGKGGAQTLPLLRSNFRDLLKEADDLGGVLSTDTVNALDDVDDATARATKAIEGLMNQVIAAQVKAAGADETLNDLAKAISLVAREGENTGGFKAFVDQVKSLAGIEVPEKVMRLLLTSGALMAERGPGLRKGQATFGMEGPTMDPEAMRIWIRAQAELKRLEEENEKATKAHAKAQQELNKHQAENVRIAREAEAHWDQYFSQMDVGIRAEIEMTERANAAKERSLKLLLMQIDLEHDRNVEKIRKQLEAEEQAAKSRERIVGTATTGYDRFLNNAVKAVKGLQTAWELAQIAVSAYTNAVNGARSGTEGAAMGALSGMQQGGQVAGPWGALGGFVAGGIAGWFGGKEAEQRILGINALNRIDEHMASADAILARLDEIRRRTQEVVSAGAQGLSAMFEAATSPEDFERLGRLALAGVEAMRAQGYSMLEIFRALRPALDAARERLAELGKGPQTGIDKMTGEEVERLGAFEDLLHFDELIQANESLIASIEGTGAVLRMLQETGNLTGQNLTDILTQVTQDYDKLIEQGFTHQQALAIQADSLRELDRLQREGLITVDALTQARIDEAKAAGLLDPTPQEAMKEILDLQLLVLVAMAEMYGITLPQRVQEYIDSLNRIPSDVTTNVHVIQNNTPLDLTKDGGSTMGGGQNHAFGDVYYPPRRGGWPVRVGEAGQGEYILTEHQVAGLQGSRGDGGAALASEIRGLRADLATDREAQRARDLAMPARLRSAVALGRA